MAANKTDTHDHRAREQARQQQSNALQQKEPELKRLANEQKQQEFFKELVPFLQPLKSYIKRRLRVAYLDWEIRTSVLTSGDLLDEVILEAYEKFDHKPTNLTLEQWLYQIANRKIDNYISKEKPKEKRRKSVERMTHAELSTLEEMPITADAEGEPWLPEDLDDSEYQRRDFNTPADQDNPEEHLTREEELQQILQALHHVPSQELIVFDLYAIEGLPKESVAKIAKVSPDQVPAITEKVREQVLRELNQNQGRNQIARSKAS